MQQLVIAILVAAVLTATGGCASDKTVASGDKDSGATTGTSAGSSTTIDPDKASAAVSRASNEDVNLSSSEKEKKRQEILKMASETLEQIYKKHPGAKAEVEKSHGYAVFDNDSVNMVLYVAGKGRGVAFKGSDAKPIFMTMVRAGTGPGVGYDDYKQLLVFTAEDAYKEFEEVGAEVGASGDLGPLYSGSTTFNPDIKNYHVHDKGFDVQVNWGGVYYVKNKGLNEE
jgi:hypothetical protein